MDKNAKQAIQSLVLTCVALSLYYFSSILNVTCLPTNKVYASSEINDNIYSNPTILCQDSLSNESNIIQVKKQIPVYSSPSNLKAFIGFIQDQQVKILNREDSFYYIEYNSGDSICRGYIQEKYLALNLQIPKADYSRSRQSVRLNKSTTIYTGPSDKYTKIDKVNGQDIILLSKESNWYFIEYTYSSNTKRGYITTDSITNLSIATPTASTNSTPLDEKMKTLFNTAESEIGFMGSGKDNNTTKYGLWYGVDNIPWSATFISWVSDHSNLKDIIPKTAYCSDSLNWFKSRKLWGDTPKVGAIIFFKNQDIDYMGIVQSLNNDNTITVLVGGYPVNNSKQVTKITMESKDNSIIGYGYPQYSLSGLGYYEESGHAVVYSGPSDQYAQTGQIDNEMVKILNEENNYLFIEYNLSGIKSRGYINSNYVPTDSKITTANYNDKKLGKATKLITVYKGSSTSYTTDGFIENQEVAILNKEDNWYFIEYTNENIKKRGYVSADYVTIVVPPSKNTIKEGNNNCETIDGRKYIYKFTNSIITSYDHQGYAAAGENYYCDGSGNIVAAHNMRAGTVIYIPDLKYINSTGIFTVGDTGGPFFDFDINTTQNIDKGSHDVYVLSWGDGPMMQSFEAAKEEQIRYGQWNRFKKMYENYTFQTENFRQP
ncbi:SH3 domain-containing protein [Clostridium aciditolerans]|uniref:SH3b domain-containing protein n=1 Tax=Clostridium aciditolerans TaxID=339861 RepID=A0A934HU51_9CLOT|nr:hypothetical protein [Clostridium aciditolerans]MBI6874340.1 hypothetical protein [Clostridium aciditolerans]